MFPALIEGVLVPKQMTESTIESQIYKHQVPQELADQLEL